MAVDRTMLPKSMVELLKTKPVVFKLKKYEIKEIIKKSRYVIENEKEMLMRIDTIEKEELKSIYNYINLVSIIIDEYRIEKEQPHSKGYYKTKKYKQKMIILENRHRDKILKYYISKYLSIF